MQLFCQLLKEGCWNIQVQTVDVPVVDVQSLSHVWLCSPVDCSMAGHPVLHSFLEFAQIHVRWVDDAIQPFCPLLIPSPSASNLSQHQGLFQWVGSSNQVNQVLELQHQLFQWIFRVDFLSDWLAWSPYYPRNPQKSSPAPQFKGINSSEAQPFLLPSSHIHT